MPTRDLRRVRRSLRRRDRLVAGRIHAESAEQGHQALVRCRVPRPPDVVISRRHAEPRAQALERSAPVRHPASPRPRRDGPWRRRSPGDGSSARAAAPAASADRRRSGASRCQRAPSASVHSTRSIGPAASNRPPCIAPSSRGTRCWCRNASSSRTSARRCACLPAPASSHRSFEASNVDAAFGSGMRSRSSGSENAAKRANSSRRPRVTAAASSASKSQKKRNGVEASNSSPMKSIGTCGESSRHAYSASQHRRVGEPPDAVAEGAVAHLVVRLQRRDEGRGRQVTARLAAPLAAAERRRLALVGEALRQRAPEPLQRRVGVVGVVAVRFAGGEHVGRVMQVVVPLRGGRGRGRAPEDAWLASFSSTRCTCRARPGPSRRARAISVVMCSGESSRIACTASSAGRRGGIPRPSRARCGRRSRARCGVAIEADAGAPRRRVRPVSKNCGQ